MKNLFTNIFFCGILCAALDASVAATVSRTLVRQQWPWHAKVHVDYRLLNDDGESIEVKVSVTNGTRAITLPSRALTGPRMGRLSSGDYQLVIDPAKLDFDGADRLDDFKVTLSVVPATDADLALYRIYDLLAGTRTDVTTAALVNGEWGDVETTYDFAKAGSFNPSDVVVWTGVTNNPAYKTNCLVMRYVPAGSFAMLPQTTSGLSVTLTKPYYIGVFEMTYAQCEIVSPGRASIAFSNETDRAMRPMDSCSFANIRGTTGLNWPAANDMGVWTYIGRLRSLTGDNTFDLPTEARWEYAARAGVTTRWNNGSDSTASGLGNPACNILSRAKYTGGWVGDPSVGTSSYVVPTYDVTAAHGTAIVGSYLPNAWGIYDMHGNVIEWCLDRWVAVESLTGGNDPPGSSTASQNNRVVRGASWNEGTTAHYLDQRYSRKSDDVKYGSNGTLGFRVICEAESAE